MCYLKNLSQEQHLDFDELLLKGEEPNSEQTQVEPNILVPCPFKYQKPVWSEEQQMLVSLFELIQKNNSAIKSMQKVLNERSEYLEKNSIQTEKPSMNSIIESSACFNHDELIWSCAGDHDGLIPRLFGLRKYKYSLQLAEDFPRTIYKERNFNLAVRLVDSSNKVVRNCNIINLCCAVSTCDAEWIHQNRVGEPFMKGKTEVELYKGQASFVKLYAREVSRVYSEGKVNLVIYSKPTTLLYSGSNPYEININSEDVMPLVIEDLVIKAKKKQ